MSSGTLAAAIEVRRSRTARSDPSRAELERAIVQTLAYADVFDYPLTADELHRYLIQTRASRGTIKAILANSQHANVARVGRYFTLAGRESTVETRKARLHIATPYWRKAVHYGRIIGSLPFVRMVAVTGALAMDNLADDDIDYLIVTEPGRLWLCRALVVGLVKTAALRGIELCPNYFISERALELEERNLFTAHEVTQMVPIAGLPTYQRLRDLNRWTEAYLPNAAGPPRRIAHSSRAGDRTRRVLEHTLRSRLASPLERWEMRRKMTKLGQRSNGHAEASFGPDWCKGHFGDHGQLTLSRYHARLEQLGAS
jgi:hypothetical protein